MDIKIGLNLAIKHNLVFFCPDALIHLSIQKPVGVISKITPAVLRGLRGKTLIDIDNVIDLNIEKDIDVINKRLEGLTTPEIPEGDNGEVKEPEAKVIEEVQPEKKTSKKKITKKDSE